MRARLTADWTVVPGGPLASSAEGGEDVRGLLLAATWLLWPSGVDTWFSQGGFSCGLEPIAEDRVALSLDAVPPSGADDLPVASAALALDIALRGAAAYRPHELTVATRILDTGDRPEWSQMNWAATLARGSGRTGAVRVGVRAAGGHDAPDGPSFWRHASEQLFVPDVPFAVTAEKGTALIEEMEPSLLNLARAVDAVRSASAAACPGISLEISASRVR